MKVHLFIIDPNMDFLWPGLAGLGVDLQSKEWKITETLLRPILGDFFFDAIVKPGSLCVPGAWADMLRVKDMILRLLKAWADIHVSLDAHHLLDQAHTTWFRDEHGNSPPPFTVLDVVSNAIQSLDQNLQPTGRRYRTFLPGLEHSSGTTGKGTIGYLKALNDQGRKKHVAWPPHTLIATLGMIVAPPLREALLQWELANNATVDFLVKGSNVWTEHYGALQAEVPDPKDPGTSISGPQSAALIDSLSSADKVAVCGWAYNFCMAETLYQAVDKLGKENAKKLVFIEDGTSPVPGFDSETKRFDQAIRDWGAETCKAADFLK